MKCDKCQNKAWCYDGNHELTRHGCAENNWCCFSPITNYDRLRAKSVEEMAFELAMSGCPKPHFVKDNEFVDCPAEREPSKADCVACWLDWLRQEVDDGKAESD